ncbi:hypothetical protein ILYODFUR_035905 [Ilyodon furcidens]|uniref:Uncharacterized protein n=1 Tax=Ilyodon furcidens TaxID=33524 RepID=A0ABV0UBM9_9TELE
MKNKERAFLQTDPGRRELTKEAGYFSPGPAHKVHLSQSVTNLVCCMIIYFFLLINCLSSLRSTLSPPASSEVIPNQHASKLKLLIRLCICPSPACVLNGKP